VVARDASGNFSAGTITASLSGNATTASTAGSITSQANSATITATSANTANQIVLRDGSGNFSAGTITASLNGNASTATSATTSGSTSGNAATATALQTARNIGGVSFNGTASIDLPGVNTAGNQNTSGNAATATTATNQSGGSVSATTVYGSSYINTAGPYYRSVAGSGYLNGQYASVETAGTSGAIYSIGGSYVPGTTTLGNMYGVGYTYSTVAAGSTGAPASLWGFYVASGGTSRVFLDSDNGRGYFASNLYVNGGTQVVYNSGTWGISITGNAATITSQANSATITASTAANANQIVLRDGNGDDNRRYGFASYFNSSDDVSSGNISHIMAKFGDNYYRSATAAKVATFISGQTMNINGSSTSCSGNAATATTATTATTANALATGNNYQVNSLGVGTAGSGTAGEIRATNNVTAFYSSDIKFKENVRDIPNAAATAAAIGGKLFDWTDAYIADHGGADGYFVQKHDFGIIAQDALKHFPVAVRTRPDGSLAVDYEKLSALALAALAEQEVRIAKLEALVAKFIEG
jgi:hypothetical protein